MIATALYAALAVAFVSALLGNRTAWVLVPLVCACLAADEYDVVFRREYWIGLDVAAGGMIVGLNRPLSRTDWIVLALFPLAWPFYLAPDPYRYVGSVTVTICQLCLTFPPRKVGPFIHRFVARWKANFRHRDEWTDLERRGRREANV